MTIIAFILIVLTGCIPVVEHQKLQNQLFEETTAKLKAREETEACLEKNKILRESLKKQTADIDQEELDEIKRKAFEEAERKYKVRVIEGQQEPNEKK